MKPPPRHEWRLNKSLQGVYPNDIFHDLFLDDLYQNIWIREAPEGEFHLERIGVSIPFNTFAEAEDHVIAMYVAQRFERAYG